MNKSQKQRLEHYLKLGTLIEDSVYYSNGYLNAILENTGKNKKYKFIEVCIGPRGGLHQEIQWKDRDESGEFTEMVRWWSALNGLVVFDRK